MTNDGIKELRWLLYALAIIFAVVEITFFKGSFLVNLKLAFSFYLLLFLPGYFAASLLLPKSGFTERMLAGSVMMLGVTTILGYFSGLIFGDYRYSFIADAIIFALLIYHHYFSFPKKKSTERKKGREIKAESNDKTAENAYEAGNETDETKDSSNNEGNTANNNSQASEDKGE